MFSSVNITCRWYILLPLLLAMVICYFFVDPWLAELVYQQDHWHHSQFLQILTILGSWPLMISITIVLYLLSRQFKIKEKIRFSLAQIALTLIISNLIVSVGKFLLGRARPMLWLEKHIYGFYGPSLQKSYWSFPSGHTVTVMAIIWSLCLIYSRYTTYWLIVGGLLVITRILLLKHYLSDVLTSVYLAMVVAVIVQTYRHRWEKWL